jgi:hypothetical protein
MSAYSIIYGQCSDVMRAKIESRPGFDTMESTSDSLCLLENIRTVMFQFQSQRYTPLALHEAKRRYNTFSQDRHMTCQQYYETFKNNVEVIEYCGGDIGQDPGLVDAELTTAGTDRTKATVTQLKTAEAAAREHVLAIGFLYGSDRARYGKLLEDLENSYVQGNDNYPDTLQQAYTLLVHWKQDPKNVVRLVGGVNDGVAFANISSEGGT